MVLFFRKYWAGIVVASLFGAAAFLIYLKLHPPVLDPNLIQGSGRIDGDLITLNAKYPGRLCGIYAKEGDRVSQGDVVACLESREYRAQQAQIQAQLDARERSYGAQKIELEILRQSLPQSLKKADANVAITLHNRDELDQNIRTQKSLVEQSERDWMRAKDLVERRLVEAHQLETALLKLQGDQDRLAALLLKRSQLDEAIRIAQSSRIEASAAQRKTQVVEEGIKAVAAEIEALKASKAQIDAVVSEMELRSPIEGFLVETIAHTGEVVGAGSPVATLIDPATLYLKIFVDTLQNGKIKIGDKAVIFLDASPDRTIEARVVRIEQKAEFTPKEVSVASDRIQRVYAVHLRPLTPDPLLKLGIPGVGVISTDTTPLPGSLREVPE
ncbi:MAG: HlyD family efflux transporter periplasmic adaptor subunit [Campylobacterales bacterium]|nr:HlyD family efflux transporter periplasmic adaptor subunit [Campylobacterales bacterium]